MPAPRGAAACSIAGVTGIRGQAQRPAQCTVLELWRGRLELALRELAQTIALQDQAVQKLDGLAKANTDVQLLKSIPGVGPRTVEAVPLVCGGRCVEALRS